MAISDKVFGWLKSRCAIAAVVGSLLAIVAVVGVIGVLVPLKLYSQTSQPHDSQMEEMLKSVVRNAAIV